MAKIEGVYYDAYIRRRVAEMISSAGKTYAEIAADTNQPTHRIKRLLSGASKTVDAGLVCAIANACGHQPHVVYDPTIDLGAIKTGVASVDKMLAACYGTDSATGLEGISDYAARDYHVTHAGYDDTVTFAHLLVDVEPVVTMHHRNERKGAGYNPNTYKGLTLQNEWMLNVEASDRTGTNKRVKLIDADIVNELIFVNYQIEEYVLGSDSFIRRRMVDLIALEYSLERYDNNQRLKPKISRRRWVQIKNPIGDRQHAFATDWIGYVANDID